MLKNHLIFYAYIVKKYSGLELVIKILSLYLYFKE